MYLMTCTRPDLAYPLSILARYVAPGRHRPEHMTAAKRVLRYLCSTSGLGLVLGGQSPVVLTGHADASWADDQATQRSSQGYTFSLACFALPYLTGLVTPSSPPLCLWGEDFQAVAAAVHANPMAVLLDSGCSHHLMGTKAIFVDMAPSDGVKHVRGFNRALQSVEGRGTVPLQGGVGKRVLIPDGLYVLGVQANLLSAGQLKESGVQLKGDGDEMLLVAAIGGVLGRARYTGRVLCTDLLPFSTRSQSTEVVALRTIVSATKSTPDRLHARLAHVSDDTIKSSAKHEVAIGLDITPSTGADPPCVSCIGGKLARHTFPDKGLDAEEALAIVHIDLCGPFRVAAKDGSLYFLLLKDRHTRFVWVMPVFKKSDVLWEFQKWLVLVERQAKKLVLMLRSDWGGEFLGKVFTDFVDSKGIVHDLTCPYTPQQNGMAEREMRTAVESMRTILLHMGWSTTPPGMTPYQLLTGKKLNLTLARVWGCMVQFMVPEQQRGGKLAPKARWVLHLGMSPESKGWEVLDLTDNKVVTLVETQAHPPTDTSTVTVPLLAEVDEPADEDVVEVLPPSPVLAPPFPVADRPSLTSVLATGDEGSLEASPVAPASGIAGGGQNAKLVDQDGQPSTKGEKQTGEPVEQEASAGVQSIGELLKSAEDLAVDEEGELLAGEESTDNNVVEVPITKPELRCIGRARWLPEQLSFHAYLLPAAFTAVYDEVDDDPLYDDAKEDEELPELDPNMHADPEHRWDISTMTVKEALASWKGEAVKAAMEEEIRTLIDMGTWELVERPRGVNIMKNRWVLTTKYRIDDTFEHEKARLVVKGFTQVCGADYDKRYSPVSSYVKLRIFLSIVAVLDLDLLPLNMKNAFLQSKLDRVLYMYQLDYFDDGTCRVCKLLRSLYGLKHSPLLWYRALDGVLLSAGWKKSQVDEALYFKAGDSGVTCWVLVYVDDLLAASSSPTMLKELKGMLEATFELREISLVVKCFIDKEQGGQVLKTPVLVDAYAELTFDDEEEEYWQKVGSLQFAATTTRPDIAFACSKLLRWRVLEFYSSRASRSTLGSGDLRRTAASVESHLASLGPFSAARVETSVSSLGACVVSILGASKRLCVGAAASTSLAPAFVACSSATSQTAPLSFTLDSGASSYFFCDCTDPSVGPVVAHITTTLPCPTAPSGFLTGYKTPSFSRNLVGISHLHDLGVVTTFPLDEPDASCTVGASGEPLATFHRELGYGLYSLHTRSHHTGLGHPSFPRLSRMARYNLVSGLPESLAPLPRSPAPPCTPCAEGRQRAAPQSSLFPPTTAPFQTLHLDVWGPSPVLGPRQGRYFLIVVDDYSRYTTVFPLRRKADVPTVLEPWLLAWGGTQGLCGLCLHSDRGGEFSSTRLETFCQGRGIIQSYMLPASPQQNGVAKRRIGLVMEVARTSMCHAGAPQFLWPQGVRYAAHQLNLWPSDARPWVAPVFLWTCSLGVAAVFRVWGSLDHVRAPGANKLSSRTRACVFLGLPLDSSGSVFYDLVTYEFFASQDVTFDEFPPQVAPVAPPPSRLAPSGVSHVTLRSSPLQRPVPVVSGGAGGAFAEGEGTRAARAGGVGSGGAGGVGVEVTPVEDTAASNRRPCPASPPGFPSVPQFPPRSSLRPVTAEPGGVPAGGTGGPEGVGGGGAGAGGTGTMSPGTDALYVS
ncbi:unnamed protein product [Closterium sp. NIES-53]